MKKPLVYISAAWSGNRMEDEKRASAYCRALYDAGYFPLCPAPYLRRFLNDAIPKEHKDGIDLTRDMLRRANLLVWCGDTVDEAVKNEIATAQRLSILATTLDGILLVRAQGTEGNGDT